MRQTIDSRMKMLYDAKKQTVSQLLASMEKIAAKTNDDLDLPIELIVFDESEESSKDIWVAGETTEQIVKLKVKKSSKTIELDRQVEGSGGKPMTVKDFIGALKLAAGPKGLGDYIVLAGGQNVCAVHDKTNATSLLKLSVYSQKSVDDIAKSVEDYDWESL